MYSDFLLSDTTESLGYLGGYLGGKIGIFDAISMLIDGFLFGQIVCVIAIIIGILGCFFGFKLREMFIGICGFATGGVIGIILMIENDNVVYLLLGLVLAIILEILSCKLYKIGVFFISYFSAGIFGFALAVVCFQEIIPALIVACIVGIIVGIVSVLFVKPTIIVSTAVSYGNVAGLFLAVLLSNENMSKVLPVIFMLSGLFVQIKMNTGFFGNNKKKTIDD